MMLVTTVGNVRTPLSRILTSVALSDVVQLLQINEAFVIENELKTTVELVSKTNPLVIVTVSPTFVGA